jgi:hypothetical protein
LPMPKDEFRKDFDEPTWSRAEAVMASALSVEVTGGNQPRDELYYECGIETVQQSGLLLALWNGEPSHGMGGTEDVVTFARGLGKPVVWIHSATGELQTFNEKSEAELLDDPELDFLNNLPDPIEKIETNSPQGLAWAWFNKMDQNANVSAPQLRRLAAIPIICTAAAALFTGAASWTHDFAIWMTIGTVLGVMAAILPILLGLHRRQTSLARTRTAAEVTRSVLACWSTPHPYAVIGPEVIPELSGMINSLNLLKMRDRAKSEVPLDEFKREYRQRRVKDQISYFSRHAEKSAALARKYRMVIMTSVGLAILANIWLFVGRRVAPGLATGPWKLWLSLGASIAFEIATVAGALIVVDDCERRQQRYREMHYLLNEWDEQLERLRTWMSVLGVTDRIERALLVEVIEWRSIIRHRKLPSK